MGDLRSLEIFAGCGGLAFGIAQAGFHHAMIVENDPRACATLTANKKRGVKHFKDWRIDEVDIRDVDFLPLQGKIALVSGGPPCQPFSIGGKHKGPSDKRNMWPEALRVVKEVRPKAFVFENVRGLLRPAFSDYLEYLCLQLSWPDVQARSRRWRDSLGRLKQQEKSSKQPQYRVIVRGINAADYGAAQKRHRAIFMGIRTDVSDDIVFPPPTHSMESLVWEQRVSGDYWKWHDLPWRSRARISKLEKHILARLRSSDVEPSEGRWKTVRDIIGDLPRPLSSSEKIVNHRLHPGARSYVGHTGSFWDEPAKALKAGDHGVPGGENIVISPNGRVRYFTVREMARLQGMPDDFAIDETWQCSIRQLGNAVPVEIGQAFGRSILTQISPGRDLV
jgi:DNA (cytosine-5)-methyltransferase 1